MSITRHLQTGLGQLSVEDVLALDFLDYYIFIHILKIIYLHNIKYLGDAQQCLCNKIENVLKAVQSQAGKPRIGPSSSVILRLKSYQLLFELQLDQANMAAFANLLPSKYFGLQLSSAPASNAISLG